VAAMVGLEESAGGSATVVAKAAVTAGMELMGAGAQEAAVAAAAAAAEGAGSAGQCSSGPSIRSFRLSCMRRYMSTDTSGMLPRTQGTPWSEARAA